MYFFLYIYFVFFLFFSTMIQQLILLSSYPSNGALLLVNYVSDFKGFPSQLNILYIILN